MPDAPPEFRYKRVLLKVSGEVLMGDQSFGVDMKTVDVVAAAVAEVAREGVEICLVIGGGNIFRGLSKAAAGMERAQADYMGMLATIMNALAMQAALEARGILFVGHGEALYEGMIIGENAKTEDLEVNPMKAKQLTNFRASGGKDDAIRLTPPKKMTLEQAIAYIDDDEMVEVTPKNIRLRKRHLDPHERKRASRAKAA